MGVCQKNESPTIVMTRLNAMDLAAVMSTGRSIAYFLYIIIIMGMLSSKKSLLNHIPPKVIINATSWYFSLSQYAIIRFPKNNHTECGNVRDI